MFTRKPQYRLYNEVIWVPRVTNLSVNALVTFERFVVGAQLEALFTSMKTIASTLELCVLLQMDLHEPLPKSFELLADVASEMQDDEQ